MDSRVQMLLEKARIIADKTGQMAVRAADTAGKVATEMAQSTRMNLQVFDLNTECEVLYKEIGKMVYDTHTGAEIDDDMLEDLLLHVDENRDRIAALKSKLAEAKNVCPNCGQTCGKEDTFCANCGAQL